MNLMYLSGLQIDSPLTRADALNFKPQTWPPSNDFPVVIDAYGNVVSRYGDVRWDLSPWSEQTLTIYFGDGPGQGKRVSPQNAAFLRQIVTWWLWGEAAIRSAKALVYKFETIKPLFVACTDAGILVTDLNRYPKVIEKLADYYKQRANRLIDCLHSLFIARQSLGFSILDESGIKLLSSALPAADSTQTAYIPSRIWSYQLSRLRECLDDFLIHQDKIESIYEFCLSTHAQNAGGSLSDAFGGLRDNSPFRKSRVRGKRKSGMAFYGPFPEVAKDFGISDLLDRWVNLTDLAGINALSKYLTLISNVGLAYLLNFSLMRVDEGAKLRAELAVKAMKAVAFLRLKAAKENPHIRLSKEDIENPVLQSLPHEPWSSKAPRSQPTKKYKKIRSYRDIWNIWPKLFDANELTITESDLELASRMTFGLDSS